MMDDVLEALRQQDAVLVTTKKAEAAVHAIKLAAAAVAAAPAAEPQEPAGQSLAQALPMVDLVEQPVPQFSAAVAASKQEGPRTIRSMYTGVIPLVFKTQRQLLISLQESIESATILIAALMAVLLRQRWPAWSRCCPTCSRSSWFSVRWAGWGSRSTSAS